MARNLHAYSHADGDFGWERNNGTIFQGSEYDRRPLFRALLRGHGAALRRLPGDDRGTAAIEYGMIVAGISVIIVATVFAIGPLLEQQFQTVQSTLENNQNVP